MLKIGDNSAPFDPRQAPEPDIALPGEERELGGLGLHGLIKKADHVDYQTENNKNTTWLYYWIDKFR